MSQILEAPHVAASARASEADERALSVLPASGRFAILTCMDGSIDPAKLVGLPRSEAQIIRNAGGRANEDAIHSLLLARKLLGARAWFVVHHSHCGMALLTEEITGNLWATPAPGRVTSDGAGRPNERTMSDARASLGRLPVGDPEQLVRADIARIRNHPHVSREIPVRGYIYRAETGLFYEVSAPDPGALSQSSDKSRSISVAVL